MYLPYGQCIANYLEVIRCYLSKALINSLHRIRKNGLHLALSELLMLMIYKCTPCNVYSLLEGEFYKHLPMGSVPLPSDHCTHNISMAC